MVPKSLRKMVLGCTTDKLFKRLICTSKGQGKYLQL